MTIASEISRLQTDKEAMRQSIINKGVDVASNVSFDDYSACIDAIQSGGGCMIEVLVVGGGGASGRSNSSTFGGGGGGGVGKAFLPMSSSSATVTVGTGGSTSGANGGQSCIKSGNDYVFAAGGEGTWRDYWNGGCSGAAGSYIDGCFNVFNPGKAPGAGCNPGDDKHAGGGGGSGAGCIGCAGGYNTGGQGGAGLYGYGGGGGGSAYCAGGSGCGVDGGGNGDSKCGRTFQCNATNYGGGGGGLGGWSGTTCFGKGCQGIVFVCYPANGAFGFTTATGGQCCYNCGGICVHRFTSNGTFTITG